MTIQTRFSGGKLDLAIYNQAEREENPGNWSKLLGCLAGSRAGNWILKDGSTHWRAIADANPSYKKHWLMGRVDDGAIQRFKFTHKEHPLCYDWVNMCNTEYGDRLIADLEQAHIKGSHDYLRLVKGIWASAEGMVYPQYIEDEHNVPIMRNDIASDATWRLSCDFGKTSSSAFYADSGDSHIQV